MIKTDKTITDTAGSYAAPLCTLVDFHSEGVLCSSIDGFDKEFDYNPWGE